MLLLQLSFVLVLPALAVIYDECQYGLPSQPFASPCGEDNIWDYVPIFPELTHLRNIYAGFSSVEYAAIEREKSVSICVWYTGFGCPFVLALEGMNSAYFMIALVDSIQV